MSIAAVSFQSLPADIINIVVGYLTGPFLPDRNKSRVAFGLFHCCHSWRAAYISTAFRTLVFEFNRFHPPLFKFQHCPDFINPLDYMTDMPVREFKVNCGHWNYDSYGDLSAWIEKSGYADLDFSLVRSLVVARPFALMSTGSFILDNTVTAQCAAQFLRRIKCMLPALSTIEFCRFNIGGLRWNGDLNRLVATQLLNMANGVPSLSLDRNGGFEYSIYDRISEITGLSSFACSFRENNTACLIETIRCNVSTLRILKIDGLPGHLTRSLLYTANSETPTFYPSLETLRLSYLRGSSSTPRADIREKSLALPDHFPELKRLGIAESYPFENNILLCLPVKLEYLHICLPILPADLVMYHVSSSYMFPNLKHMVIQALLSHERFADSLLNRRDTDFIKILKAISYLAADLCRFELSYPVDKRMLFYYLATSPIAINLRILNINQTKLGYSGIATILQTASSLQTLECSLDETPLNASGGRLAELSGHMHSAQLPLSSSLVSLKIKQATPKAVKIHIRTVVLLAISCPRFSEIELPVDSPATVFDMIQKFFQNNAYQRYAYLVEPLLFRLRAKAIRMGYDME